jgi:hypothetical protein
VTVPVTPGIVNVLLLMLAGSMGELNTTAISRSVPTPLLCGTTINTAGPPPTVEAGGLVRLPQLMRKAATKRAGETFEIRKIDIEFLSQYLVEIERNTPSTGATLVRAAKVAWEQTSGLIKGMSVSVDLFRIMPREAEAVCSELLTSSFYIVVLNEEAST